MIPNIGGVNFEALKRLPHESLLFLLDAFDRGEYPLEWTTADRDEALSFCEMIVCYRETIRKRFCR